MTPIQATKTLERSAVPSRPQVSPRPVVLTRSETAGCNCPENCERDHEVG